MKNNLSDRLLKSLQGKVNVDTEKLRSLANQVKPGDFEDEEKLRSMIRSVAMISGKTLSAEKEEEIIEMFRSKELDLRDMSTFARFLK
jgi:hypothetical protein